MRDRTADLLNANQALSQLSYSPSATDVFTLRLTPSGHYARMMLIKADACVVCEKHMSKFPTKSRSILVGLGGLEPPTSPLSGVRSNHLSYRPLALKKRHFNLKEEK